MGELRPISGSCVRQCNSGRKKQTLKIRYMRLYLNLPVMYLFFKGIVHSSIFLFDPGLQIGSHMNQICHLLCILQWVYT